MANRASVVPTSAPSWQALLEILGHLADGIWELDTDLQFVRVEGEHVQHLEGRKLFDLQLQGGDWAPYRQQIDLRQSLHPLRIDDPARGERNGLVLTGFPAFDENGNWQGYRGTLSASADVVQQGELDRRLRAVVNASPDCIFLADVDSQKYLFVNDSACEVTGYSREELLQMCSHEVTGQPKDASHRRFQKLVKTKLKALNQPPQLIANRDGSRKGWWESHHRATMVDGRWAVVTVSREVTSRVLAEKKLERTKRMYAALSATNEGIMKAKSAEDIYQAVCEAAVQAGGLPTAMVLVPHDEEHLRVAGLAGMGKRRVHEIAFSVAPDRPEGQGPNGVAFRSGEPSIVNDFLGDARTQIWHPLAQQLGVKAAASFPLLRNGKAIGVLYLCAAERNAFNDEIVQLLQGMAENLVFGLITVEREQEREQAEERIRYLATHDSLTGLPNRVLFGELLDQACANSHRHSSRLAVLFIDLDRFKLVNDTLGHAAGDLLLKEMAGRLRNALRGSDTLARMGGDEFVVLLPEIQEPGDAAIVANKLLEVTAPAMTIRGQDCRVTASIGVSIFPDHGEASADLMRHADTAMYLAKSKGKNGFEFYEPGMHSQSVERLALEASLRDAIDNNELYLQYQPKLQLASDAITGVEALLRWNHPTLGNIPPDRFIPLAEENGNIVAIGRWVLHTACQQSRKWQLQGLPPVVMAVNISPRQFTDPNLFEDVQAALEESRLAPQLLELEITEGMVMHDPAHTIELLTQLRALGVRVAIDDFGVGHSSLAQLKGFPIDTLKVDGSFIRNLPDSDPDRAITEAIIKMAHSLKLTVVAECVETQAQEEFLRSLACDETQGYYFSKPISAQAVAELFGEYAAYVEE